MASKIASLKPSFSELPSEARMELILSIRANRRISKRPPAAEAKPKRASTVRAKAPTKSDARALVAALSPAQIAELLASLNVEKSKVE